MVKLSPSILSADFARLGEQVSEACKAGADLIHVDVMDGHFVPNISFGPALVKWTRPWSSVPFDTHLMLAHPQRYVEAFADAGADVLTVHVEADDEVGATLRAIRRLGRSPGLVVNPRTPLAKATPFLPDVDMLVIMSVEPGFGGQSFDASVLDKVRRARTFVDREGLGVEIEVDGGIKLHNVRDVVEAGADIVVAGSAIFPDQVAAKVQAFRETLTR